jgi:hypothetical protein
MSVLDSAIAYYLGAIMAVLALTIIIGVSRQKANELRARKSSPTGPEGGPKSEETK